MATAEALEAAHVRQLVAEHRNGRPYPRAVWVQVLRMLEDRGCNTPTDFVPVEPAIVRTVAASIGVSTRFVQKVAGSYFVSCNGGEFGPVEVTRQTLPRALNDDDKVFLLKLIQHSAERGVSQNIESMRVQLARERGVAVSFGTIRNFLRVEMKWSKKVASKRCIRKYTIENINDYVEYLKFQKYFKHTGQQHRLRFLDECHVARSATGFQTFWGPVGITPEVITAGPHGGSCTVFGVTSIHCNGNYPVLHEVLSGGVTKEYFYDALRRFCEIGVLVPGDILVLDNASVHGRTDSQEYLQLCMTMKHQFGVDLVRLPKYSPEFNPIELVWNMLKQKLRQLPETTDAMLPQVIEQVLRSVTVEQVRGAMRGQGYF
jgi:hypothetical protein